MLLKSARLVQKLAGAVLGGAGAAILVGNVMLCIAYLAFGPVEVLNNFPAQV